ncbi:hypothetical protein PHLGIDRAFT_248886 [Phlebiopsis gigantea 11061_1 CR5-6]|uniref:Uncharacterized protein n=1 Tax=Phlebiopsis gigantea (strain 11061_1 CR5-6) TaxID=745531 RepID=A0A0C3PSE0_PHLG1|nr:hypothetical protein PHLGIDRAFT_248886 [Phlebiopsis gigantea 11061_1 CR5-6]
MSHSPEVFVPHFLSRLACPACNRPLAIDGCRHPNINAETHQPSTNELLIGVRKFCSCDYRYDASCVRDMTSAMYDEHMHTHHRRHISPTGFSGSSGINMLLAGGFYQDSARTQHIMPFSIMTPFPSPGQILTTCACPPAFALSVEKRESGND